LQTSCSVVAKYLIQSILLLVLLHRDGDINVLSDYFPKIILALNELGNQEGASLKRFMITLFGASISTYRKSGVEFENSVYFSVTMLYKIAQDKAKIFNREIRFDNSRISEKKYYTHAKDENYIKIKKHLPGRERGTYIALTEKGKAFCEEIIREHLPQNERSKLEEIILRVSTQNQQAFLAYSEFRLRTDIDPLLKYKEFVGRENNIKKLFNFLCNINKKIMIVTGENGIGKTRLVLEFAKQLQSKNKETESDYWHVYFIHPNRDFSTVSLKGLTLLVLDDGAKYRDLGKLIDFVLNAQGENDIKLLVTVSSLFAGSVKSLVKEKNFEPEIMKIEESDIRGFLRANFDWIDENIAIQIESQSGNSFVYAIVYAEYWREKGVSDEHYKILSWKIEKYIADTAEKTRSSKDDVEYVIDLISLAMPLDWTKDKECLKTVLSNQKYVVLENLLQEARINMYEGSLFLSEQDSKIIIKPDALADFLRLESLKNGTLNGIINELIQNMPLRIAFNVVSARAFDRVEKNVFIFRIWKELNTKKGHTQEYIYALRFLTSTDTISNLYPGIVDLRESRINQWLESFEYIYQRYPEERLKLTMALTISNIYDYLVENGYLEEANRALEAIRYFRPKLPEGDFLAVLSYCLRFACKYYAENGLLKGAVKYLKELTELYEKYPQELRREMAWALCYVYCGNIKSTAIRPKLLNDIIRKLRQLYQKYPDNEIGKALAGVLVNAIRQSTKLEKGEHLVEYLKELRQLYQKYPNEVREYLGFGSMTYFEYLVRNRSESLTDELEELSEIGETYHKNHIPSLTKLNDYEVNEIVQEEQELCATAVNHEMHIVEGNVMLAIHDDLKMPNNIDHNQEAEL